MTGSNGRLPEPFPGFPDRESLQKALADRKKPPSGRTEKQTRAWRQSILEGETDEWVAILAKLGRLKEVEPALALVAKGGALIGGQLERFDMRPLEKVTGTNFSGANLRGSDWSDMDVKGCKFANADLSRACLYRTAFTDCDFTCAEMSLSYMKAALFHNCKMPTSMMKRASAKHALFVNCDLRWADVSFADFLGAKWSACELEGIRGADYATFVWYRATDGSARIEYVPTPGFVMDDQSQLGTLSFQENAARRKLDE